jgi:hypothetical protein
MWADFRAFCRFHGLPWPVGRIVGGPLPWHIRNPEKVTLIRGRRNSQEDRP